MMTTSSQRYWETVTGEGARLVDKVKEILHEGSIRRIVVEHEGKTIAEFPLTAGVIGAVLAPVAAAIGAMAAMLKDCTIKVEHDEPAGHTSPGPTSPGPGPGPDAGPGAP